MQFYVMVRLRLFAAWPGTELCRVPDPSPAPVTGVQSRSLGPELELEPG